jgi:NADH:ubiquinone oxidoreductase subunit F (NADH-binding)
VSEAHHTKTPSPWKPSNANALNGCWRTVQHAVRGEKEDEVHWERAHLLTLRRKQVEGHTICALGDAAAWPIQGLMRHFRECAEAVSSGD